MTKKELSAILSKHSKWLKDEDGGERANLHDADLQGANLRSADLQGADLHDANLRSANLRSADLQGADLRSADLRSADLQGANLHDANLHDANLHDANLDFSCLPLWCGGSKFKADAKIVRQILAHVSTIEVSDADDDLKAVLAAILPEAKKSHRAGDLGLL